MSQRQRKAAAQPQLRVLHVSPFYGSTPEHGGIAASVSTLAESQATRGASVTVFVPDPEVKRRRALEANGVVVSRFPSVPKIPGTLSVSMISACLTEVRQYDILHAHGLWNFPAVAGAFAARRSGTPYVISPCGMLSAPALGQKKLRKKLHWWLLQRALVRSARILHFTTVLERTAAARWVNGKASVVVPRGIDLESIKCGVDKGEFRDRLRLRENTILLAFLGRINPIKGLGVLFQSLRLVLSSRPNTVLGIAGPDEKGYKLRLQSLAHQLGITNRVKWVGTLHGNDKFAFLRDADLFVLPSYSENFGLAALEAMAVGCPVLVSDQVGIAADIQAAGAGYVSPVDVELLAKGIVMALSDPTARRAHSASARRLIHENYNASTIAQRMLDAYRRGLAGTLPRDG